jgi:hypothetical protein
MNLGDMPSWGIFLAVLISAGAIVGAVWNLAREASKLQLSMISLSKVQAELAVQLKEHIACFSAYQREQAADQKKQAEAIQELRVALERLTWEVQHLKGE